MRIRPGRLATWLESRGCGPAPIRAFLTKPIPRNISWIHTLGSLLLVYLLYQMLTGILLGLYYSPSPEHAHDSVRYVNEELLFGRLILQLHRWGAGFLMVTAFLHVIRSYFLSAYKKPRELLWLTGLALGVLLTLFAFTGQLLPYDQHGYWATVVGVRIASSVPLLGDAVRALLTGGYGDIGAVTLSRFYILHVCALPLVLFALLGLHLGILQRVGSAGPLAGSPEPQITFYPSQMVRDVLVAAGGTIVLLLVAALVSVRETGPADPASGDFVPRPEWYFLAHYEILRILPGSLQLLGTFVLPNILIGVLVLLPFVDRGPERALRRRKLATGAGILVCLALIGFTMAGIAGESATATTTEKARDPVVWGRELFREKKCIKCHTIAGEGGNKGPVLDLVANRLRPDYIPRWIRNPRNFDSSSEMPSFEGTEDELQAVVSFLTTLK